MAFYTSGEKSKYMKFHKVREKFFATFFLIQKYLLYINGNVVLRNKNILLEKICGYKAYFFFIILSISSFFVNNMISRKF